MINRDESENVTQNSDMTAAYMKSAIDRLADLSTLDATTAREMLETAVRLV